MTRDSIDSMAAEHEHIAAIYRAASEGRPIQYKFLQGWTTLISYSGDILDALDTLESEPSFYRVAPERVLRPWTAAEAIGKVVRHKVGGDSTLILWACMHHAEPSKFNTMTLEQIMLTFVQPDGSPCGVVVDEDEK